MATTSSDIFEIDSSFSEERTVSESQDSTSSSKTAKENLPDFELPPPFAYVFKNDLFTRTLLPIDLPRPRKMVLACTTLVFPFFLFNLIIFINFFKGATLNQQLTFIIFKHRIANDITKENTLILHITKEANHIVKKVSITFFFFLHLYINISFKESEITDSNTSIFDLQTRKRPRNNTIIDNKLTFEEDEAYSRILNFLVDNNISFNVIGSKSFIDLLKYYNP